MSAEPKAPGQTLLRVLAWHKVGFRVDGGGRDSWNADLEDGLLELVVQAREQGRAAFLNVFFCGGQLRADPFPVGAVPLCGCADVVSAVPLAEHLLEFLLAGSGCGHALDHVAEGLQARGDPRPGAGVQVCRQVLHQVLTGSDGLGRSGEVRPPKRPVVPLQSGLSEPMSADVERAKTTLLHRENSGQTSESWHRRSPRCNTADLRW